MIILGWIAGALMTVGGGVWYTFNKANEELAHDDAEMLKLDGPFKGEPDMKNFHVTRVEFDIEYAQRQSFAGKVASITGAIILLGLTIRGLITGAWLN